MRGGMFGFVRGRVCVLQNHPSCKSLRPFLRSGLSCQQDTYTSKNGNNEGQ